LFSQLSLQQTSSIHRDKGDGKRRKKAKKCGLYSQLLDFHFYIFIIGNSIFLCTQEQQRALSVSISPICGDGYAIANPISGGDVLISEADQQGHDMGTQVFSYASSIFPSNCGRHRCQRHFI
jgi:hypothetical protein